MSFGFAQAAGRRLGALAWHVARRERNKALRHFAVAFPESSERERREAIRGMFRHLGMSLLELVWLPNLTRTNLERYTVIEGMDEVVALLAQNKGAVAITGHCGNWELLAWVVALHVPVTTMHRERDDPEMNRFIVEHRASGGMRTIDRGSAAAAKEMLKAIRSGGLLAFLIDQNIRTESVGVPFFGRLAPTPIAPARFAIRAEAPVIIFLDRRMPDGRHHIRCLSPIFPRRTDDPVELTAAITRAYEDQIRTAPEQWVWMHDRWKERPQWDVGAGAGAGAGEK
jgi:KDO2-lipid IV(A) lauroyltransferase